VAAQEFEKTPVTPQQLQPARYFAASYAGEHVAGTEFVIGAMFVAWGVPTMDILWGLLWGNLLAVLTWGLVCAPIATDTRLTLYAYLEKIAGPGTIRLYSVVNGVLFCVLAGAMITVSASAVRILFDIPAQVHWYPTDAGFVLVAVAVGAVVVTIAALGFRRVAQFAEVCAPWMILMFIVGALALLPSLVANTPGVDGIGSFAEFRQVADTHIWRGNGTELTFWHVAAFAWVCNLAMHGGLGDMTVLRFARRTSYGYFSALGMFIGHYLAWVCAGIMGAGAALALQASITQLDAGAVAFQALGAAGIVAVIIAGWTTSNPTIYRAGLAFQSLNHNWDRVRVTVITGVVTTVIACFPFVFSKLMDFVGLMGLILAPVGAVIVTEHWLFPRLGLTRYWSSYSGRSTNGAAVAAWALALLAAFVLNRLGLHLFFLLLPTWVVATVAYLVLAASSGAREPHSDKVLREAQAREQRQRAERDYLSRPQASGTHSAGTQGAGVKLKLYGALALAALACCAALGVAVLMGAGLELLHRWLLLPSLVYFVSGTLWAREKEAGSASAN
jgi:NCS1 family nucleobase:cation symporter-1